MKTIIINLGKAYYTQGFFNIKKEDDQDFGDHNSPIQIQLGNDKTISGYINRTANPIGTPRIMCGVDYTNWVEQEYKQGDMMLIEVLALNKLRLRKNK